MSATGLRFRGGPDPTMHPRTMAAVAAVAVVVGTALVATIGGLDPQLFTLGFGVVVVVVSFALRRPLHRPVLLLAVAGWAAALWFGGVRDVTAVVTQLAGAGLLALVALRTTSSLAAALRIERDASAASRTRASLLASVLRLQSLEPDEVAEAVVRGVQDAGFDVAALRLLDGDRSRLVAVRTADGMPSPPATMDPGEGVAGIALREGRAVVVDHYPRHPVALEGVDDLGGMIAVPVRVEEAIAGVLVAGRRPAGVTELGREAVELLAKEVGAALRRARRFTADAATVAELRRLEGQTNDVMSTVSHELRTPMTVITGLGQTLARRWDDLDPARRADLLRRIEQNAERLGVMLRSLVDTSALERGQLVARPMPVDLATGVGAVLGRLTPVLEDHLITVDVPPGTIVVADQALVEHVLENLLTNAARHTPPGTRVSVTARHHDDEVEVAVADDGPGIPGPDLPHVLERFYRAGEPATRPVGGLGLGLALSQQVLRAHDRELTVSSTPGRGTRFAFELPAATPPWVDPM